MDNDPDTTATRGNSGAAGMAASRVVGGRYEILETLGEGPLLATYRDNNELGGYVRYTPQLKATDANKLSQTVQALQDSLSRLAEKVATA